MGIWSFKEMTYAKVITIAVLIVLLAACGKHSVKDEGSMGESIPASGDATHGATGSSSATGTALTAEEARNIDLLKQITVYFDYDSSEIRSDFNDMLRAHARQLAQNPNLRVRLEGHADERGSREYNIALGERRAQAVRQVLQLQGASSAQLSTVSYGEEKPVELGHDDASWAKNRRVVLTYAN
jgi:peptidoglycan-associated lipoprotein